jgi:hypothetical protein
MEAGTMSRTDHADDDSQAWLQAVLASVRTIALVGASANPAKPSHQVMQFLLDAGYDVIPVNPRAAGTEILGQEVQPSLESIDRPVDMVDVFRPSRELPEIARQAVAIGARVLWGQLDIQDDEAARIAEAGGLTVVMNRCPKIELNRRAGASG